MGISLSELVSSQLPFLADNYQVMYENPDFAQEFTFGETGFADSQEGLRTWERYEELVPYLNEDCATVSNTEIEERFFDNRVGHLIQFSSRIPEWMNTYGEEINKIGFFALPGDTKEATGLTIWPSNGIYGNKKSENTEAILAFMEWYVSEEGQDVMTSFYSPAGVFHTGYQPKEKSIELVQEVQKYYTEGNIMLALEYLTPIKGINCAQICNKLGSGRISALEAAEAYDEECRKMALQIGLWE
ncbi:extracellular solute-binding protein [Eisenbergiella tayi]|uniref:extracellular solute-binding protein n=1 Tax=Eisenbergiella tayi TaxID=1432052 RepID=UPI0004B512E3